MNPTPTPSGDKQPRDAAYWAQRVSTVFSNRYTEKEVNSAPLLHFTEGICLTGRVRCHWLTSFV